MKRRDDGLIDVQYLYESRTVHVHTVLYRYYCLHNVIFNTHITCSAWSACTFLVLSRLSMIAWQMQDLPELVFTLVNNAWQSKYELVF